jgi:hypothetical protein
LIDVEQSPRAGGDGESHRRSRRGGDRRGVGGATGGRPQGRGLRLDAVNRPTGNGPRVHGGARVRGVARLRRLG